MDSNLANRVSHVIEIEDDVIDLDGVEKTPEEVIYEWDAKIRKKLSMFAVADNENILGDLMKEYLQSLQEMARIYDDNESLKNKVFCHISFLYSYYVELQCCNPDNYLNNMEDILTVYCNLELEVIRPLKKKDFSKREYKRKKLLVCRRIIHMLTVYLLERHDHILHVLIKMNTNGVSDSCSEVLNVLYTHFLTKVPAFNLCDESFCRSYIVFQKWKEIRKVEDWEGMDKIMYKMFKRTPESIKNNETLQQILTPACQSTVSIVLNLFRSFRDISNAYFKHVIAKKNTEMDDLDFNIDLGEDEPAIPTEDENEEEEEVTFLKAYYEVERNMSNLPQHMNESSITADIDLFSKCKEELDEDDDVQFIGIITSEPQSKENFIFNDNENVHRKTTLNKTFDVEEERIPVSSTAREKGSDLEHLNGITKISSSTTAESPSSCSATESQEIIEAVVPGSSSILESDVLEAPSAVGNSAETEANQPKVSLASSTTQFPSPASSPVILLNNSEPTSESDSVANIGKRTTEMKSVEVQTVDGKNHVYNDYGLTTPPFDVSTDEPGARSVEPCLYTSIGQEEDGVCGEKSAATRTVEMQVDPAPSDGKNCVYNDYGLTPPNETSTDEPSRPEGTCLYTDIGRSRHKGKMMEPDYPGESPPVAVQVPEDRQTVDASATTGTDDSQINVRCDCDMLPNTKTDNTEMAKEGDELARALMIERDYDDFDHQLDISRIAESDAEEIDVESCQDKEEGPLAEETGTSVPTEPEEPLVADSYHIDTGQSVIPNTAPNIAGEPPNEPSTAPLFNGDQIVESAETKDFPETVNGNTILKPLVSSNRTNGQTKDSGEAKIMYTSTQKIKASLDDFSKFENSIQLQWSKMKENHDLDKVFSGPVTKITPTKHNLLSPQDRLDIFQQESNGPSRSNSPAEMTSPAYEGIDDFRNYFSDRVNGRVAAAALPPPPPQGILKKSSGGGRKKNYRIVFHESTCDRSAEEERRPRSDGVMVPKRVRRDRKLNMEPRVVVERLSFIENKMKKILNNPPTLRVDYDKTTRHINEKDVVRCISPPRFSWVIKSYDLPRTGRHNNSGSLTVKNREHLEKKPKKRKFEPQSNSTAEPAITRKRAFRTSKKKPLGVKGSPRKRRNPSTTENNFVSKSDSEFDKLLNSGSYSNKPFRLDLTS